MVAGLMSFSYLNRNTAEWIIREPVVVTVKMSVVQGDGNLAQLEFFNADGANVARCEFMLRHGYGLNGEVAPYFGDRYVVDYRNSYSMVSPNGVVVFTLNHQKQQSFHCPGIDYIVRYPSGAIRSQRIADVVEPAQEEAEEEELEEEELEQVAVGV